MPSPSPRRPNKPRHLDRGALTGDSARVARVIADTLLDQVKKKSEDLQADDEPDALHDFRVAVRRLRSWVRAYDDELNDTLKPKQQRRLGRLADATRASRDLEVHIEWVEKFTRARRRKNRAGTEWLIDRLRAKKARADLELRRVLDADLERAVAGVGKALGRYTVDLEEPWPPFAYATAVLIRDHAVAARRALASVTNVGDRIESHEARIAAKRLRYLLEPLRASDDRVEDIVERLSELQDDFGALHDAQLFGSEIARLLAKVLASTAGAAAKPDSDAPADDASDRAEVLLAISRRLHRDEESAFRRIEGTWLAEHTEPLWTDVESIAATLDEIASETRPIERSFLLTGMVDETPPRSVVELDHGYLPGDRVAERVTRERGADGTRYHRTIDLGSPFERTALADETTERVFDGLWPLTKGRRLRVRRHAIESDGRRWMLDELVDRDTVIARVRVSDPNAVVPIPDWLEAAVDCEISNDTDYDLRTLSGVPLPAV